MRLHEAHRIGRAESMDAFATNWLRQHQLAVLRSAYTAMRPKEVLAGLRNRHHQPGPGKIFARDVAEDDGASPHPKSWTRGSPGRDPLRIGPWPPLHPFDEIEHEGVRHVHHGPSRVK